jgi:hypothetical protein
VSEDFERYRPRPDASPERWHDGGSTSEQSPPEPAPAAREQRRVPPMRPDMGLPATPTMGQQGPAWQPSAYIAPNVAQRYSTPLSAEGEAQLIHPAAAHVTSYTPYGVPVYRAPVYPNAQQLQRGLSITAMVLGITSAVFAWALVVVPIIGVVFGFIALRREPAGRAMAITGLITSGVGLLWVLLVYLLPLLGLLGVLLMGMSASP